MKGESGEIEKVLAGCFVRMDRFKSGQSYTIKAKGSVLDGQQATLGFVGDILHCYFSTSRVLSQDERDKLHADRSPILLANDDDTLVIDFGCFGFISLAKFQDYDCTIRQYRNDRYPALRPQFHRLVILSNYELKTAAFIEAVPLRVGSTVFMNGIASVDVDGTRFHLFPYSDRAEKRHFLIIDSMHETTSDKFLKCSEAILLAYAFISGHLPREKRYLFTSIDHIYENPEGVRFETTKRSFHSGYSPIPQMSHQQLFGVKQPRRLAKAIFDRLCDAVVNDCNFSRTLSLVVEANTLSLALRAAAYSVGLEAMTSVLSERFQEKLVPIKDKPLARKIVKDLRATLLKYQNDVDPGAFGAIDSRLRYLNAPTNKEKLLKPFVILGVNLPAKDKICIESRNDFLHGRIPLDKSKKEVAGFTLEQIVLSLHFAINCLILKSVGYAGYATYYPAVNEFNKKVKLSEHPFRVI